MSVAVFNACSLSRVRRCLIAQSMIVIQRCAHVAVDISDYLPTDSFLHDASYFVIYWVEVRTVRRGGVKQTRWNPGFLRVAFQSFFEVCAPARCPAVTDAKEYLSTGFNNFIQLKSEFTQLRVLIFQCEFGHFLRTRNSVFRTHYMVIIIVKYTLCFKKPDP